MDDRWPRHDGVAVDVPRRPPIRYVGFPWQAARWLFSPRDRIIPQDTTIKVLTWARSILGVLIIWFLAYRLRVASENPEATWVAWWKPYLYVPVVMVGMWPIMLGLLLATEPRYRRDAYRQLRWPALSVLGLVAVTAAVILVLLLYGLLVRWLERTGGVLEALLLKQVEAVATLGGMWLGLFIVVSFVYITTPFRADDGHPYLSPLLSFLVAWASVVIDLLVPDDLIRYSGSWQYVVSYSAAVTVTGLAVYQIKRIREIYGIELRKGPWPQRWPDGTGPATTPPPDPPPLPTSLAWAVAGIGYLCLAFAGLSAAAALLGAVVAVLGLAVGVPLEDLHTVLKPFVWLGAFLLAAWYILRYARQRSTIRVLRIREVIVGARQWYWRLRRRRFNPPW